MACNEVIECPRVEVIRSCSWPISSARLGWEPTADGIRPSRVETSDPAWVNRKMLSMNSSTSCFCTSRKYSAMVSAERATRSRVPGGSSICPNTRAVCLMTPVSVISAIRSLPSRVRSPTPANTDTPPWFSATRWIISWISTVLPTPAPPNRPILPPRTYGVSRSMTLIPVSNIWVLDSSWSKAGGLRWIAQRSVTSRVSPSLRLSTSPVTLKTWPLVTSPTGTLIGAPVSVTIAPRTRPSVGLSAIARTIESPRCWATSSVIVKLTSPSPCADRSMSTKRALYISGRASAGNSMSTTGPMTRAIRPFAPSSAGDVQVDLRAAVEQLGDQPLTLTQHRGGVRARHAAVGGDQQHGRPGALRALAGQRVVDLRMADDGGDRLGDRARVRPGRGHAGPRLADPGRGHQLHGAEDLLQGLGRPDPVDPGP